jgi:hypothetical protein
MLRVGFQPTTPVFARAKRVHAFDREATVIGKVIDYRTELLVSYMHYQLAKLLTR